MQWDDRCRRVAEALLAGLRGEPVDEDPEVLGGVVERAAAHGVLPVIADRIDVARLDGQLAHEVRNSRLVTAAAHLSLVNNLPSVSAALEGAGVPWVAFKGPVLAVEAYGDPSLRRYADLDVLVPPRHFGAAIEALRDDGARLLDTNWAYQLQAGRAEASLLYENGPHIDLHWHLCNERRVRRSVAFDVEAAVSRRRNVVVHRSTALPSLDAADTVLATVLHAAMNGAHRLLWLKDVERLGRSVATDWELVVERAREAEVGVPVGAVLNRSRRLLGAAVPGWVTRRTRRSHPWAVALAVQERRIDPVSLVHGRSTGRAAISAARDGFAATVVAGIDELRRRARTPADGTAVGHELLGGEEDPAARNAYLRAIVRPGA